MVRAVASYAIDIGSIPILSTYNIIHYNHTDFLV